MSVIEHYKKDIPESVFGHCIERLMDRYDMKTVHDAERAYVDHHIAFLHNRPMLLYKKHWTQKRELPSFIYRLEHDGRVYYPVRRWLWEREAMGTVTYLDADMVNRSLMNLYVKGQEFDGLVPHDRSLKSEFDYPE